MWCAEAVQPTQYNTVQHSQHSITLSQLPLSMCLGDHLTIYPLLRPLLPPSPSHGSGGGGPLLPRRGAEGVRPGGARTLGAGAGLEGGLGPGQARQALGDGWHAWHRLAVYRAAQIPCHIPDAVSLQTHVFESLDEAAFPLRVVARCAPAGSAQGTRSVRDGKVQDRLLAVGGSSWQGWRWIQPIPEF